MHLIFVTGTAGSGKSLLTSTLAKWYLDKSQDVITVNLDPGATSMPYEPDVDIREMIDIDTIMENYELGPNGALIFSADLMATKVGEIQEKLDSLNSTFTIVDTPGQIELFAYRESGPAIVKGLDADSKVVLFTIDQQLASNPANFLSLALLSVSIQLRLALPQFPLLTKVDLDPERVKAVISWSKNAAAFEDELSKIKQGDQYTLYSQLFRSLRKLAFSADLYPVSSLTMQGFVALVGEIARITESGVDNPDD